jgi:Secreted protein acidic and rich in cysteine Ca binding region.
MDKDGDGFLVKAEYRDLRRLVKKAVKPKRCAKTFTRLCDLNEDERISRDEWSACLTLNLNCEYLTAFPSCHLVVCKLLLLPYFLPDML